MKSNKTILLALLGILIMSCSGGDQTEGPEELVRTVNVRTKTIGTDSFASYLRVVGKVETLDDILISSEVSGRVVDFPYDEGDRVRKNQVISIIDDAKLVQQEAQLAAAAQQAKENYERLKRVFEEDNVGSEINYLNAKYSYDQVNAQLKSVRVDLANTRVKAPFNGIIESHLVREGEMASPGSPLIRFIGSEKFLVSAGVPARYSDAVSNGDVVDVWFDSQDSDTLQGSIRYVASSINTQNRTFRIEVELPDSYKNYKVDMVANMRLETLSEDSVIVISEEFIYRKNDKYVVYVAGVDNEGNQIALEKEVELGPSYKTKVIIREGLYLSDELITIGSAFLNDEMRIEIINENGSAVAAQ